MRPSERGVKGAEKKEKEGRRGGSKYRATKGGKQSRSCPVRRHPKSPKVKMSWTNTPSAACVVAEELTRSHSLALHSMAASRLEISVWLNQFVLVAGIFFLDRLGVPGGEGG